jgi:hypothetical protein
MWSNLRTRLGVVAAAAVLATACAQSQTAPAQLARPPASPAEPAEVRTGLPGPLSPDLEQRNLDGVAVRVERITFQPDRILVDLHVRNASRVMVALASSPYTGMTLRDDRGGSYNFEVPKRNKALKVPPGQTVQTQIAFTGALPVDASTLTLVTNDGALVTTDGADDDPFVPRFEFAGIPLSGESRPQR